MIKQQQKEVIKVYVGGGQYATKYLTKNIEIQEKPFIRLYQQVDSNYIFIQKFVNDDSVQFEVYAFLKAKTAFSEASTGLIKRPDGFRLNKRNFRVFLNNASLDFVTVPSVR